MSFGRRLQNHPRLLERAYRATRRAAIWLQPLSSRLDRGLSARWAERVERVGKRWIFDCRMCGRCVLHQTGMTCPMTCPKNLRNGPCGGVRGDGGCEVEPEMRCVWVEAVERSRAMHRFGAGPAHLQAPLDWRLEGTSAWINALEGADASPPPGWRRSGDDVRRGD
jgi:hypothetical protein